MIVGIQKLLLKVVGVEMLGNQNVMPMINLGQKLLKNPLQFLLLPNQVITPVEQKLGLVYYSMLSKKIFVIKVATKKKVKYRTKEEPVIEAEPLPVKEEEPATLQKVDDAWLTPTNTTTTTNSAQDTLNQWDQPIHLPTVEKEEPNVENEEKEELPVNFNNLSLEENSVAVPETKA